jgi:LytS/YehU family sensor histidine kinase
VRHYLEIMQMRMGGRLVFSLDVPAALGAIEVPPLILLTLVENAVKHGIAPQIEGGSVRLRIREDGDCVEIEVADTGAGVSSEPSNHNATSTGIGLDNLRGRLHLVYGEQVLVELLPNAPHGTRVRMRIPRDLPPPADAPAKPAEQVPVMAPDTPRTAGPLVQETRGSGQ